MEIEKQQRSLRASGGRCMWIDVLRALLIITVIVGHSNADARMIQNFPGSLWRITLTSPPAVNVKQEFRFVPDT